MVDWQSRCWYEELKESVRGAWLIDPDSYRDDDTIRINMLELALEILDCAYLNLPNTNEELIARLGPLVVGMEEPELEMYCVVERGKARRLKGRIGDLRGLSGWILRNKHISEVQSILAKLNIIYEEIDEPSAHTIKLIGQLNQLRCN